MTVRLIVMGQAVTIRRCPECWHVTWGAEKTTCERCGKEFDRGGSSDKEEYEDLVRDFG